ncbi:hypothetical protein BD560DRAFT_164355 [Blakeslea trispora]|nr:hypothetical protein BD560DRAFT_164355 [Blakeslea trispora]
MPSFLLDQERQTPSLIQLETHSDSVSQELKESVETAVGDLPLGKALHLLLHVHNHVFDKAIETIRSSATHLLMARIDSPTVRAILSIQHYLLHNGIRATFHHVYGPLKEKILKKGHPHYESAMRILSYLALYSTETAEDIQACLKAELEHTLDKRSQLACVLVMQFFSAHGFYQPKTRQYVSFALSVVPLLLAMVNKQTKPTLLTCSAVEVAIQFLMYIIEPSVEDNLLTAKIEIIKEETPELSFNHSVCQALDSVLDILAKWQNSTGETELAAYQELHCLLASDKTQFDTWLFILTYLTPKAVMSERPISIKRQKKILSQSNSPANKLIVLTLLQKSEWHSLCASKLLSTEQQEMKELIQSEYKQAMSDPSIYILLPVLISTWSDLFPYAFVQDARLMQAIVDNTHKASHIPLVIPMILKAPESVICHALMSILQPHADSKSEFSYQLLTALVEHHADQVMPLLEPNLLSVVKTNTKACELLIHCMSFIRLPPLIHKLMVMAAESKENEKERMTYIALISKALLHDSWRHDSILYYIELLR